ncbi:MULTISPECIES: hypothetical protein [Streptomyces]|uniref:hypothetical protein n=1 Tax=Streptomyces TaxID=1883 RepID=UPI00163CFE3D|nr:MULTISPECIES: hypothetical protein [Streptomyces]MBC2877707.1 hypothetical protein [Streptomyces sp. TYQ1024]UBI38614.1 hypothetical protein K7I03_20550 [Streptomyces mobaraensis]UKW31196.1 hypothetical protein MCU78_20505 [Streptomyces sp. TYQ1024]
MPEPFDDLIPPKPEAVAHYERIAGKGEWYDEGGCLLAIVAALGALDASTEGVPAAYAALLLVPLVIWLWVLAVRRSNRLGPLEEQARAYVRGLLDAQEQGAVLPELSPRLKELLNSEKNERRYRRWKEVRKRRR